MAEWFTIVVGYLVPWVEVCGAVVIVLGVGRAISGVGSKQVAVDEPVARCPGTRRPETYERAAPETADRCSLATRATQHDLRRPTAAAAQE